MSRNASLVVAISSLAIATTCPAPIEDEDNLTIDFSNEKDAHAKAEWSVPDGCGLDKSGLGCDVKSAPGWWVKTNPLPIGLASRPAVGAIATVTITSAKLYLVGDGPKVAMEPSFCDVFARYSPDYKHWSSWQPLVRTEKESGELIFKADLVVPTREQEQYDRYLDSYLKSHRDDGADEEAIVRSLLQSQPDFFEHSLPFIGYIQFLLEGPKYQASRIKRFEAEVVWGVSGFGMSSHADLNARWRFKAR